MAVGNTFGATALSSYGGFWISYALLFVPSLAITDAYQGTDKNSAIGFFLTGWFIFTTILLLCTLRSTIMFFSLFFTLDLAFLCLFCAEYATDNGATASAVTLQKAGGGFGMLAAFLAWYNAFAGIADSRFVLYFLPSLKIFVSIAPVVLNTRKPPPGREHVCFFPLPLTQKNTRRTMPRLTREPRFLAIPSSSSPCSTFPGPRRAGKLASPRRRLTPSKIPLCKESNIVMARVLFKT